MRMTFPTLDQIDPAEAWQPWQPTACRPLGSQVGRPPLPPRGLRTQPRGSDRGRTPRPSRARSICCSTGGPYAEEIEETLVDVGRIAAERDDSGEQLRGWWLYCMLQGGHPLREKLTLFWHNHFATSLAKVQDTVVDVPPELPAAEARPGPIRPLAPGDQPRRGHAGLARFQQQRQGKAERELCPRADGAVQPGRRPLHREGHPRGRPCLHRLAHRRRELHVRRLASTTVGPRRSWARPAPGTAATWCGSCWSSRRRLDSWSASSTTSFVSERSAPPDCTARAAVRVVPQERLRHRGAGSAPSWRRGTSTPLTPSGSGSRVRSNTCWARCRRCTVATVRRRRTTGRCRSTCSSAAWPRWGRPVRTAQRQGLAGRPVLAEHLHHAGARQLRRSPGDGHALVQPSSGADRPPPPATRTLAQFFRQLTKPIAPTDPARGVRSAPGPGLRPAPRRGGGESSRGHRHVLLDLYLPGGVRPEVQVEARGLRGRGQSRRPRPARRVREAVHAILAMAEYQLA